MVELILERRFAMAFPFSRTLRNKEEIDRFDNDVVVATSSVGGIVVIGIEDFDR